MGFVNELIEDGSQYRVIRIIYVIIAILGTLWFLSIIMRLMKFCWKHNCRRHQKQLLKKYGHNVDPSKTFAVVTGGSDGIGLAYCKEFAKQGFNICIIGRNEKKINEKFEEIKACAQNPQTFQTKTIIADFAKLYKIEDYEEIQNQLKDIDIGVLVLNAGITGPYHAQRMPFELVTGLLNVNVSQIPFMTRRILPQILARQANRSAILIVSSLASFLPAMYGNNYHASKAFATSFAKGLSMELKFQGVDVMAYCPAEVDTKLIRDDVDKPKQGAITPQQAVDTSLRDLGIESHTMGSMGHDIMKWALGMVNFDNMGRSMYENSKKQMETNSTLQWIRDLEQKEANTVQ